MSYYIIRNYTVEHLFGQEAEYSHYNTVNPDEVNESKCDTAICFLLPPVMCSYEEKVSGMNALYNTLQMLLSRVQKKLILLTIPHLTAYHALSDCRLSMMINKYNELCYLSSERENVVCFDFACFVANIGIKDFTDWRHYYASQIAFNPKYSSEFKSWFEWNLSSYEAKRKKCIVLDLDNTLWGGVIGEDGIDGISLGGDYPGSAFQDSQRFLLSAYEHGVILAICSKNNEADAMHAINEHPNMILRDKYFAIKRINWQNKADNIRSIAETLNIGLDSLVFVDDNPSERALVKRFLPDVTVPDFPEKPYLIPIFINKLLEQHFTLYRLTVEDRKKTEQYKQNAIREQFKESFSDYSQYLAELEMSLEISLITQIDIPRVAQLTQKTNQFNLTTKRYTEDDIKAFIKKGDLIYVAKVSDKFGDYGLTGVCICKIENKTAEIDTLLMSCRVIGREVENEYLNQIILDLKNREINRISATYIKTKKNAIVSEFYEKEGFKTVDRAEGSIRYKMDLNNYNLKNKNVIKVIWKNERED